MTQLSSRESASSQMTSPVSFIPPDSFNTSLLQQSTLSVSGVSASVASPHSPLHSLTCDSRNYTNFRPFPHQMWFPSKPCGVLGASDPMFYRDMGLFCIPQRWEWRTIHLTSHVVFKRQGGNFSPTALHKQMIDFHVCASVVQDSGQGRGDLESQIAILVLGIIREFWHIFFTFGPNPMTPPRASPAANLPITHRCQQAGTH